MWDGPAQRLSPQSTLYCYLFSTLPGCHPGFKYHPVSDIIEHLLFSCTYSRLYQYTTFSGSKTGMCVVCEHDLFLWGFPPPCTHELAIKM